MEYVSNAPTRDLEVHDDEESASASGSGEKTAEEGAGWMSTWRSNLWTRRSLVSKKVSHSLVGRRLCRTHV